MSNQPLVSVVIPAYNAAKTIAQTIQSILIQDVPLEILVIDDGSKDNLLEVLDQFGDKVQYHKNERNSGVAKSRNNGVALAKGRYIAFLDADDWWEGNKLKRQIEHLESSNAVMSSTARELVDEFGHSLNRIIPVPGVITYEGLLRTNSINCSSVVVRRDVILNYPMEKDDLHEDYLTWLRILKDGHNVVGLNEPLLKYRYTVTSKSGNKFKSAKMHYNVYRELGIHPLKSMFYFFHYAFSGLKKYIGLKGDQNEKN